MAGGVRGLPTLTLTELEVAALPAASQAFTASVWAPLGTTVVSQLNEYGGGGAGAPAPPAPAPPPKPAAPPLSGAPARPLPRPHPLAPPPRAQTLAPR